MDKFNQFFLLGLFLLATYGSDAFAQTLKIGDPAPPIRVEGWLRNQPEESLKEGEVHVVEFWATWCQPCLAGIPHLNEIAEKYADQGLKLYGVSIFERKGGGIDSLRRFMQTPVGKNMAYSVAMDGSANFMKTNWVEALGQRGIPFAVVVDRTGRISWYGHPNGLDEILPDILAGNWDLEAKRNSFDDHARLTTLDGNEVVNLLNPYMGKDYAGGLVVLDSLLEKEPGLLYYPKFGHFMTFCLIGTKAKNTIPYIRSWWNSSSEPSWKTISDAVYSFSRREPEVLTPELYLLGAEALQAQLENYPWSMNFKDTYLKMAGYYEKAGLKDKAEEMKRNAANVE